MSKASEAWDRYYSSFLAEKRHYNEPADPKDFKPHPADFAFSWFLDRNIDEMVECLRAFDEMCVAKGYA